MTSRAHRRGEDRRDVRAHHTGLVSGGSAAGGISGLVIGLFAPPLLLSTAVGAAIGAGIGGLVKRHEEKQLGVELEEYLPPGSSVIVVVVEDEYLDRVDRALAKFGPGRGAVRAECRGGHRRRRHLRGDPGRRGVLGTSHRCRADVDRHIDVAAMTAARGTQRLLGENVGTRLGSRP